VSASTAGAVKARIESLGLSLAAYRDGAPIQPDGSVKASSYPFAVVHEGVALEWERHGDTGDPNAHDAVSELVQVDVYQLARRLVAGGSQNVENYALPEQIVNGLRSATSLTVRGNRVYGVLALSARRWPITDNVVRHTVDVTIRRDTGRA
jgi:hypothetical protein